jgi:Aspartyl-tRNA synthetase
MKRTNYAGDTNEQQVGQEVVLKGWVAKRRNLGGLIFIDLWDREGIVQLVFNEKKTRRPLKWLTRLVTNTF